MDVQIAGARVLVMGLGVTGLEVTKFLATHGAQVYVQDDAPEEVLREHLAQVHPLVEEVRVGGAGWVDPTGFDLVVPSPGVAPDGGTLKAALDGGVPVWSEIELAFRFLRVPIIAITGSNGKSTTTTMLGKMLAADGRRAFVGGNLGTPLVVCAGAPKDEEVAVVEVSSFQLEHVHAFRPRIALLLNLCEDHLDRYRSFQAYVAAKAQIFARQTPEDLLIANAEDPHVMALAARARARRRFFSLTRSLPEGIFHRNGWLICREGKDEERFGLESLQITGAHNLENVMAVILAARAWGVSPAAIRETLAKFRGLRHRLERVREVDGVSYYDDSKATNVGAAVRSIESFARPVVLIAGGKDKGGDYGPLREAVARHVKSVVLVGEAAARIKKELGGVVRTIPVESYADAVATAHREAEPGDVVLLAPACSSFDMFKSYAERGEHFAALVRTL